VVAANYNCPGQLVISGETVAVESCEAMKAAEQNALYYYRLVVHSTPMMEPAREELAAIKATTFAIPSCPVYQNVTATAVSSPEEIKKT
jgi:[acyl-carrier-protein] S-malonyltransferase